MSFFLMEYLFYRYNKEEMMLVCLNQNGQKALIDMLSYYLNKDGKSDALVPNVPIKDPDVHKKLRTELQNYITKYSSDSTELISSFDNLCKLEDFVNNTKTSVYEDLCNWDFHHPDYHEIENWDKFWKFCCDNVLNVLVYLHENKAFDVTKLRHKRIEFERIIPEENKYFLFKKYHEAINYHYGTVNNIIDLDISLKDRLVQIPFNMQFTVDDFEGATEWTKRFGGFGAKRRLQFRDISLTAPFTETLYHSVKNLFEDALGPFNDSRYKTLLTKVNIETIKINGKKLDDKQLTYESRIKNVERGAEIPSHYKNFRSPQSSDIWELNERDIEKFVFDLLQIEVNVGKTSWSYNPACIKTVTCIDKKNGGKWTVEEMLEVDKAMVMAQEKFNNDVEDVDICRMKTIWCKDTRKINYTFQLAIYSQGIRGVAEEVIPLAQELVLEIPTY